MQKIQRFRSSYRIKRRKSILKNRVFWLSIFIFPIFSGIFYLISFFSFFQIEEIKISGNQKVSSENLENIIKMEVERKILFYNSKSIFLVKLSKIKEMLLRDFPQLARADLKRSFPDKIYLRVEERQPIATFCFTRDGQMEDCFFLDEEGIVFEPARNNFSGLPKIIGNINSFNLGERVIEKKFLEYILEIKKKLAESQKTEIKEFIPSEKKLIVVTAEGWQIFFDRAGNISDQILNLITVLKEKIPPEKRGNLEYIDLRFGNKAYLKYR